MRNQTKFVGICAATLAMLSLMNINSGSVVKADAGDQAQTTGEVTKTPQTGKDKIKNGDNLAGQKADSNNATSATEKNDEAKKASDVTAKKVSPDKNTASTGKNNEAQKDGNANDQSSDTISFNLGDKNKTKDSINTLEQSLDSTHPDGSTIKKAYPFNATIDAPLSTNRKIKWRDDLTEEDIANYFNNHVHIERGDNVKATLLSDPFSIIEYSNGEINILKDHGKGGQYDFISSTGKGIAFNNQENDEIDLYIDVKPETNNKAMRLKPNKWYKWQLNAPNNEFVKNDYLLEFTSNGQIDYKKINDYIYNDPDDYGDVRANWKKTFWIDENKNMVYAKTNEKGEWAEDWNWDGIDEFSYPYQLSNDPDAIDIPKVPDEIPISDKHVTDKAIPITSESDIIPKKIKWSSNLTGNDLVKFTKKYLKKDLHVYIGKKNFSEWYLLPGVSSTIKPNFGSEQSDYDEVVPKDTTVDCHIYVEDHLKPNTWYKWSSEKPITENYKGVDLPQEIQDRISVHKDADGKYTIAILTDDKGSLPVIDAISDALEYKNKFPSVLTVSTDPDAIDISDLNTKPAEKPEPKPIDNEEGFYYLPENSTETSDKNTDQVDNKANTKNTIKDKNDTLNVNSTYKPLILKKNAFLYDEKGKLVKTKYNTFILWKRYRNITPKDNGKVYNINGKEFYRVGKNRYIKKTNTTSRLKFHKVSLKGFVKGYKKVRLYDLNGEYVKKLVAAGKKLTFDRKGYIKHYLCYRISGTNLWIRAYKVKKIKSHK